MDGWMDGTNGWMDGWNIWTDGHMDGPMKGQVDGDRREAERRLEGKLI